MRPFLLDTNVLSEWVKPRPDPKVVAWLEAADEDRLYLSVATLGEIRRGIELLKPGKRREQLDVWLLADLRDRFEGRILAIDERVAEAWGRIMARAQRQGIGLSAMDSFFAATAEVHRLTLVTRNIRDFTALGVRLLSPWDQ
jgi:toxin FitB